MLSRMKSYGDQLQDLIRQKNNCPSIYITVDRHLIIIMISFYSYK